MKKDNSKEEITTYYALQRIDKNFNIDTLFTSFNKYELEYIKDHIKQKGNYQIVPLFSYTPEEFYDYIRERKLKEIDDEE